MTATAGETARLLEQADRVLSGAVPLPRGRGVRIATLLARSSVEDIVLDACADHGVDVSGASMRVKLATLVALTDPRGSDLAMAWWGLSRACHQHAYEIAPNPAEVSELVASVRSHLDGLDGGDR